MEVLQNADEVTVEARAYRLSNERFTMFGAEDQMNQDFREGLRHRSVALTGQENPGMDKFPGRCPGLMSRSPLGWMESVASSRAGSSLPFDTDDNQYCPSE